MRKALLGLVATLSLGSFGAQASSVQIEASNNELTTQVCYVAASEGLKAAKSLVTSQGFSFRSFMKSVTCNNMSIADFANKYHGNVVKSQSERKIQLVAKNNDLESQVCVEALTYGLEATVKKFRINQDYIYCNGISLPKFVQQNRNLASANIG